MTDYYIGKQMSTQEDFLNAPDGLVVRHQSLDERWKRAGDYWLLDDGSVKVKVSADRPERYFSILPDSGYGNEVYELPEGYSCNCGGVTENDVETIKPVEFVPLYPNPEGSDMKETPRGDVLREAEYLITGDRNVSYGSPTENFRNISQMWTTRLRHKMKPGEQITASEVADLMVLVKVARNIAQPKRDSYTDMAGYAACGYEAFLDEQ